MGKFDGDGSYQELFANIYGMNKTNTNLTIVYKEYNVEIRPDELALQLSFLRVGNYRYVDGKRSGGRANGNYWENRIKDENHARFLDFLNSALYPQNSFYKGYGAILRCVAKVFCFIKHFCYFSLNKPHFIFAILCRIKIFHTIFEQFLRSPIIFINKYQKSRNSDA